MGNLFSTSASEIQESSSNGKRYIYPGVYDKVVIKGFTSGKSDAKGTPYVGVELYSGDGTPEDSKEIKMWLTPNTQEKVQTALKHLCTKVANKAEIVSAMDSANTVEELAQNLNQVCRGGSVRFKFAGEEYEYNGEVKEKAIIGFVPFAECITEGLDTPVVAAEDSKLTYNKDNKWDMRRLEGAAPTSEETLANNIADL